MQYGAITKCQKLSDRKLLPNSNSCPCRKCAAVPSSVRLCLYR